jgi:hypothetical protein
MIPSIEAWLGNVFWLDTPFEVQLDARRLLEVERALGVGVALDWSSHEAAMVDCVQRVGRSEEFAIRLLSLLLPECSESEVAELSQILDSRGSKWLVARHDDETFRIVPRDSGPIQPTLEDLARCGPAYQHLVNARAKLGPPDLDPAISYFESVKAVEAAGKPAVMPNDKQAQLGKMIGAIRTEELRWETVLGHETVADVVRRMEILWKTEHERHGTDKPPPPVTAEQAQAAFALALGLVEYFADELIRRKP